MKTCHNLDRALALLAETHLSMGMDPRIVKSIAAQKLVQRFGADALKAVDHELGRMGDESFREAITGNAVTIPMSFLCSEVVQSALGYFAEHEKAGAIIVERNKGMVRP